MRNYELVVVLDGKVTAAKKKSITESLGLGKSKVKDWGVKELAYQIKKSTSGAYLIFQLELEPSAVKALNEKLRLNEEVIRFLLVANY